MHRYIKPIFIYLLIMFFMYVILLRETIIEGRSWQARARDRLRKAAKSVGNVAQDTANRVRDESLRVAAEAERVAEAAAADAKRVAEAAAEAARAAALAALEAAIRGALGDLLRAVTGLESKFALADQKLSEISNMSTNLEKNVNADINVSQANKV